MFFNSFNYLRGIAILIIVAGHCCVVSDWIPATIPGKLTVNLIAGGTSLFVFISGFLFHHIFYPQFTYIDFMAKKVKNVLSPYIVFSIMPIILFVFVLRTGPYHESFFWAEKGVFYEYFRPLLLYLLTGRTFFGYWYIPFIMVIFVLSPLFVKYINLSLHQRMVMMLLLFFTSALIHRPINNLSVLQSVIYYTPIYLLGIMASMHRDEIYDALKGKDVYLLLTVLILDLIQVVFYENTGNFHKDPFKFTVVDINILQKSIMCLFFMVWLHRFEHRQIPFLGKIADAGFAIYFIHAVLLTTIKHFSQFGYNHGYKIVMSIFDFLYHPFGLLLYFIIIVSVCFVIAVFMKLIFRSYSRLVIGW